ncbi:MULTISPECIES: nuclear transport factor 2 family protein [Tsukamurella]|uniref:Nuclear transport factor 2 family protein n=2 Tax=Tsukamurella TaxID=2060 RepID=A0A5C5RY47_9ACTN|nr:MULTISPECIES: nuclear transport factor 2 family protein [Tsukamurella]NMD58079.1 nuclear transport factor 2 family protein [Tsukamurella columbiensis]TWS28016.1 nuclear transport factor 2 family protein [Tsukamurella conjunctivitidis]
MTENSTPRRIAETYFRCWEEKDFEALRPYLAADCVFTGVFGVAHGPEEFLRGLGGMAAATDSLAVRARVADGTDVITWFDLGMGGAPQTAVANWTHVENGLITAVNVTFDPREILAASA